MWFLTGLVTGLSYCVFLCWHIFRAWEEDGRAWQAERDRLQSRVENLEVRRVLAAELRKAQALDRDPGDGAPAFSRN